MWCASADWMERNFFRRVEVAYPLRRKAHRERVLRDLETYLRDDTQAWKLQSDGVYTHVQPPEHAPTNAQSELLATYAATSTVTL
jgi:polyphosphate kinase